MKPYDITTGWAETRKMGKKRFVLRCGLVRFGIGFALIWGIGLPVLGAMGPGTWDALIDRWPIVLFRAVVALAGGLLVGLFYWWWMELTYLGMHPAERKNKVSGPSNSTHDSK